MIGQLSITDCENGTPGNVEAAAPWRTSRAPGTTGAGTGASFRIAGGHTRAPYYLFTPDECCPDSEVIVSVHGISLNAAEHQDAFARACARLGKVLVAPLFRPEQFPKFQRLGISQRRALPRADLALIEILEDVSSVIGCKTDRVYLFGYSGGAQFAHRFAMLHPERVIAAALGAPGWYTFPDPGTSYPRGLRFKQSLPGVRFDMNAFLKVPMTVLVGERDCERSPSLNTGHRIDTQQGYSRVERGLNWVRSMRAAARSAGYETPYGFTLLRNCGHDYLECMNAGDMGARALEFLLREARCVRTTGSDHRWAAPSTVSFAV